MERFVPAIQERLRKEGFPKFQAVANIPVVQTAGILNTQPSALWEFTDVNDQQSIVLGTQGISFTVAKYSRFQDFLAGLQMALLAIHEIVSPSVQHVLVCGM